MIANQSLPDDQKAFVASQGGTCGTSSLLSTLLIEQLGYISFQFVQATVPARDHPKLLSYLSSPYCFYVLYPYSTVYYTSKTKRTGHWEESQLRMASGFHPGGFRRADFSIGKPLALNHGNHVPPLRDQGDSVGFIPNHYVKSSQTYGGFGPEFSGAAVLQRPVSSAYIPFGTKSAKFNAAAPLSYQLAKYNTNPSSAPLEFYNGTAAKPFSQPYSPQSATIRSGHPSEHLTWHARSYWPGPRGPFMFKM